MERQGNLRIGSAGIASELIKLSFARAAHAAQSLTHKSELGIVRADSL